MKNLIAFPQLCNKNYFLNKWESLDLSETENHLTLTNREELHSQVRKEHICRLSSQLAQVGMTGCRTFRKVVRSK